MLSKSLIIVLLCVNSLPTYAVKPDRDCFGPLASKKDQNPTALSLPASPSAEAILSSLPVVHATSRFPSDGRIIASRDETDKSSSRNFRTTLTTHFSLGAMVPPNETSNWDETSSYAIIFPFRHIAKKSINFLAQDTAVLGDVHIPSDAVIVVAHDAKVPANSPYEIKRCAPNQKLSAKVDQVIGEKGYWGTKLLPYSGYTGDSAESGGRNINDPAFTTNLRARFPGLTLQSPTQHPAHQLDIYFSRFLGEVFAVNGLVNTVRAKGIRDGARIVRMNIDNLNKYLASQKLDSEQDKLVRSRLQEMEDWLNLVDAEVMLQETLGATLSKSDVHKTELLRIRADHDKVRGYLQKLVGNREELDKMRLSKLQHPPVGVDPKNMGYMTQHLSIDEFGKLFDSMSKEGWGKETATFKATYTMQRLARSDVSAVEVEKLLKFFDETIASLPPREQDLLVALMFKWPLRTYMGEPRSPELVDRFEKLVNLPRSIEVFRRYFQKPFLKNFIRVPDSGPLVFRQMLQPVQQPN